MAKHNFTEPERCWCLPYFYESEFHHRHDIQEKENVDFDRVTVVVDGISIVVSSEIATHMENTRSVTITTPTQIRVAESLVHARVITHSINGACTDPTCPLVHF